VLAESDLELLRKEVKEQLERVTNEIANLQQLEQRLNAAIQNQENNTTGDAAASSKTEKEVTAVEHQQHRMYSHLRRFLYLRENLSWG